MKGLIRRAAALLFGAAVLATVGCYASNTGHCTAGGPGTGLGTGSWDLYDRCYPQRYWYLAERSVDASLAPQVQNGQILDQTVWTYHFVHGTDCLTPGGLEHLAYLARRRPHADTSVYVQTANDTPYDPAHPDQLAADRQELDGKRVQAVQKFLVAHTAGRPADFHVFVHDPGDISVSAFPIEFSIRQMYLRFRGGTGGAAGAGGGAGGTGGTAGTGATGGAAITGGR